MAAIASGIGRALIVAIFLSSALGNKIPRFAGVADAMAAEGVPFPRVALAGAIGFLVAGSLSVLAGWKTKIGSSLLLVFLILATFFFHDFWNFAGQDRQFQMIQFMKNLSLMGTMIFLGANGPGAGGIDGPRGAAPAPPG